MTPNEALEKISMFVMQEHPQGQMYLCETEEYKIIKEAIDCLMIYIKHTTIDSILVTPFGEIYVLQIRSKITKQIEYEKIVEFFKKYYKEEYEKCLIKD